MSSRLASVVTAACLAACTAARPEARRAATPPGAQASSPPREPTTASPQESGAVAPSPFVARLSDLRVTHGEIVDDGTSLIVDHPVVRAVVGARLSPGLELRFTYRGPTVSRVALGSGDQRVQIGIKLRAADGCNVIYAMLRIEPEPGIVVQVKRNPRAHTHDECSTGGYRTMKADRSVAVPPVAPGSRHRLRALMRGRELSVWLDDALVWEGDLGSAVLSFDGPAGLRADNGRFDGVVVSLPPPAP